MEKEKNFIIIWKSNGEINFEYCENLEEMDEEINALSEVAPNFELILAAELKQKFSYKPNLNVYGVDPKPFEGIYFRKVNVFDNEKLSSAGTLIPKRENDDEIKKKNEEVSNRLYVDRLCNYYKNKI